MKTKRNYTDVKPYYLGLDLGTNSIGWAATDTEGNLLAFRNSSKKYLWGARLFEVAETAATRRMSRTARRRTERKKYRLALLRELFADEISQKDPLFFVRLRESKFHFEDKRDDSGKTLKSNDALFADSDFTDAHYHTKYPTIYHLRKDLMENNHPHDVRLVFLALHHIIKHRGHFLIEGNDLQAAKDFRTVYQRWVHYLRDEMGIQIETDISEEMANILVNKETNLITKKKELNALCAAKDKQRKAILAAMAGGKVKLSDLWDDPSYDEEDKKAIEFRKVDYESERDEYEAILNERIELLDILKSIYDWTILHHILGDFGTLSEAKVTEYEKHKEDLKDLKELVKGLLGKETYQEAFLSPNVEGNYVSYIGTTRQNGRKVNRAKKSCTQEEVNKYFKGLLQEVEVPLQHQEKYAAIWNKLENNEALPKQSSRDNSVIPYQVHLYELRKILEQAAKYLPFLTQRDETGFSVQEKIEKILTFRIPYYVGPLNTAHQDTGFAWAIKKQPHTRVLPWNFDEVIDREGSAEKFITRMTNTCTYLIGEDVLPKNSLLYSRFTVLNELNNISVDGYKLKPELKKKVFDELFKTNKNVTIKRFRNFLKKNGQEDADQVAIGGVDETLGRFMSSYAPYMIFKEIFGKKIDSPEYEKIAEDVIRWKCLYGEDRKIFLNKLKAVYGDVLANDEIQKLARLKFNTWGRLSAKLLLGIPGTNRETGEHFPSIMEALENTSDNLMILLSSQYTFAEGIEAFNIGEETSQSISYDRLISQSRLSAPVKRTVWQAIKICEEIRKINKGVPKRIYLEMTRGEEQEKKRKSSRKTKLLELYKACKNDSAELLKELEGLAEDRLRSKRLYLYYQQKGRCMYTGEKIDLDTLMRDRQGQYYDIDHIYPRSLTKDDSFDNLALVTSKKNKEKKADFPLDANIQEKQSAFWKMLREQNFISVEKYRRLTRRTSLTAEELAGFINRQIVETSQSAKAMADILRVIYPDTELVFVKAKLVSEYRHSRELWKIRELNPYHHAHDAYLNIVIGNVYHEKFTQKPYAVIKKLYAEKSRKYLPYNLDKMLEKEVRKSDGSLIWDPAIMNEKIENTIWTKPVNVTRMPQEQRGALYNATLQRKGTPTGTLMTPLKASDERLHQFEKYGGYINLTGAYFIAVEHEKKGKRIITLEPMLLMYVDRYQSKEEKAKYCEEILGLVHPKVVGEKILPFSKLVIDGYPLYLRSRTNDENKYIDAYACTLEEANYKIFQKVVKCQNQKAVKSQNKKDNASDDLQAKFPELSDENLEKLYQALVEQITQQQFAQRPNNAKEKFQKSLEPEKDSDGHFASSSLFQSLTWEEKVNLIFETVKLTSAQSGSGANLKVIGGSEKSGIIQLNKKISGKNVDLVNESVTGLFSKIIPLARK